ncbi:beta-lactamase-like protein [Leucosporidium creatinivorum]|uniref:Beta-lactamase-like protein n=1 Tax=Leucosporidium creatinivorum TaxID=106004 RepID=A0A1Y2F3P0_9BASI|nr:beta-lactamase-like protein [Leucosporidium creatinivorum]
MQSLPTLPSVTKLSSVVTRVLGQNPGRYTLQGTNTYLLSHPSTSSLILLDTAQGISSYIPLLRPLLNPSSRVTIILSHWHEDHVGGLPAVLRLLHELGCPKPKVWKFAEAGGTRDQGVEAGLEGKEEAEWLEKASPDEALMEGGRISRLRDGQVLKLLADGRKEGEKGALDEHDGLPQLEVIHTPGHTSDSISILLTTPFSPDSASSSPPVLFTFDTVLGHGTAVFEDLGAYMSSLTKCFDTLSALPNGEAIQLYPGHGEVIDNGAAKLKEYLKHRQEREDQVVEALKSAKDGEKSTAEGLCATIYGSTIPDALRPAATRGLILHLEKLEREGRVERAASGAVEGEPMPGWNDGWRWGTAEAEEGRGSNL